MSFAQLTEGELVALFLAERLLQQCRGTPYGPDLVRAFSKITTVLTDPITADAQRLSESLSFGVTTPPLVDTSIIRALLTAIVHKRRVNIDYWTTSQDEQTHREVDP